MKTQRPLQIFFLIVMLFSPVGGAPYAYAATNPSGHADAIVTTRELSIWDATYVGYVNASAYEKWQFALTEDTNFSITVTPAGGDLVALLILLDANGNELTRATGSLNSVQKAGNYFIQVQPQ